MVSERGEVILLETSDPELVTDIHVYRNIAVHLQVNPPSEVLHLLPDFRRTLAFPCSPAGGSGASDQWFVLFPTNLTWDGWLCAAMKGSPLGPADLHGVVLVTWVDLDEADGQPCNRKECRYQLSFPRPMADDPQISSGGSYLVTTAGSFSGRRGRRGHTFAVQLLPMPRPGQETPWPPTSAPKTLEIPSHVSHWQSYFCDETGILVTMESGGSVKMFYY